MSVLANPLLACLVIQDTLEPNYLPQVALPVLLVGTLMELENMSTGGTPAQHVMLENIQKQREPLRQPPARTVKQVNTQKQWEPLRQPPARIVKQVNTLWLQPAV